MQRLFINGRFLTQRQTGVQRYAFATLCALDAALAESPIRSRQWSDIVVLAPRGTSAPRLRAMGFMTIGPFTGVAWEQLTLPLFCGRSPLIGFTTTGPLFKSSQVITMHDAAVFAVPRTYSRAFRAWYRIALPILVRRSRLLVTVSEFSKAELIRHLGRGAAKAVLSDEGWEHVLREASEPGVLGRHGLRPRAYILAVGSITPHKNLDVVARAALRIPKDLGVQFVIAGPINSVIFGPTELRASDTLKPLGYVSAGELRALYENALAFVHPSKYEGFGIPPLEAMALGCPVVASSAAAIPEVCGDAALYFPPDDPDTLALRLITIATQPNTRAALVARGNAHIKRHSWRAAADCYLDLIERFGDQHEERLQEPALRRDLRRFNA